MAIDETGVVFGANLRGLAFLDVSSPGAISLPLFTINTVAPDLVSTSGSAMTIQGGYFDPTDSVYFGSAAASAGAVKAKVQSIQPPTDGGGGSTIQVGVPAAQAPGVTSLTVMRADGWYQVAPQSVTYGVPQLVAIAETAGSPSGGTGVTLMGYGFDGGMGHHTQVSLGASQQRSRAVIL